MNVCLDMLYLSNSRNTLLIISSKVYGFVQTELLVCTKMHAV